MRSSIRSHARTSTGRRRIRACAATACFGSTSSWHSLTVRARTSCGRVITPASSSGTGCVSSVAAPTRRRTSRTCSPAVDPALLERVRFPLGEQTKEETRAEAATAGLASARRAESQEACFLGGDDYRAFLERQGVRAEDGEIVDEAGVALGSHQGHWRFTPGQRRGLRLDGGRALYVLGTDAVANTVTVGPRDALAVREVEAHGRLHVPVDRADVKVRYRSARDPGFRGRDAGRISVRARRAGVRRRSWAVRGALRRRCHRRRRCDRGRCLDGATSIAAREPARDIRRRHPRLRARGVLHREWTGSPLPVHPHGRDVRAALVVHQGLRARPAPGDREGGRHGRPRERPARQARHRHGQRRVDGGQRGHRGPGGLDCDHDPGEEGQWLRGRCVARSLRVPGAARRGRGGASREGRRGAARERGRRGAPQAGQTESTEPPTAA